MKLIYIPLCFYLYDNDRAFKNAAELIYIPLCFYLYILLSSSQCPVFHIYIPLCFYLYYTPEDVYNAVKEIYIPLCFYLYKFSQGGNSPILADLHSTMFLLIRRAGTSLTSCSIFTFHYVSTYTPSALSEASYPLHLHSTMFLLIPAISYTAFPQISHLHSTMFLLIHS